MQFIIAIDGGGTKTIGQIEVHQSNKSTVSKFEHEPIRLTVGGSSLSADYKQALATLTELCNSLIKAIATRLQISVEDVKTQLVLAAGLAGAGDAKLAERCKTDLSNILGVKQVEVLEDCETALLGASTYNKSEAASYALISIGTGSFFAFKDRDSVKYLGGWGFPIGDECSGAQLGFQTVQRYLQEYDFGNDISQSDDLYVHLQTLIGKQKPEILRWLAQAKQRDFANIAKLVFRFAKQSSFIAKDLINHQVSQLSQIIDNLKSLHSPDHLYLTGGIANAIQLYLSAQQLKDWVFLEEPSLLGAILRAKELCENHESSGESNAAFKSQLEHEQNAIDALDTEQRRLASMNLDMADSAEIVALMNQHNHQIPNVIDNIQSDIARAIDVIITSLQDGGRLVYVGAGTSGRLGVLDASECPPTFGSRPEQVIGLIAGGNKALLTAVEGAEDDVQQGQQDLIELKLTANDCVVGIAASGRTPYVVGALQYAKSTGAKTVALTNNASSKIGQLADIELAAPVGPEVLSGSTRLASGTAQKLILNMLSTGAFVQLGKCYENLMVDVSVSNEKLYQRAINIIKQATGCEESRAREALEASERQVKVAILMIIANLSSASACKYLNKANGKLRVALANSVAQQDDRL